MTIEQIKMVEDTFNCQFIGRQQNGVCVFKYGELYSGELRMDLNVYTNTWCAYLYFQSGERVPVTTTLQQTLDIANIFKHIRKCQ